MRSALGLALALVGATGGALPAAPQAALPPNILVIYADDLGWGDLGSYGHHSVRTPNLDRLASEGLRLTAYYAPSPLCSPSRASLLTGRIHFRTGIESWIPPDTEMQLGDREITLAELLREQGYQTLMAGKWHLNAGPEQTSQLQPDAHGFDHWLALHAWAVPHMRNPRNFFRNGEPLGEVEGSSGQITTDEVIEWLDRRDPGAPFFAYVPYVEVHSTIANPDRFNAMYADYTRGTPDPFENGLPAPPDNLEARGPGEYWANITWLDHQVGQLLEHLDRQGLRDSTFVFFASDNGPVTSDWRRWWEVNLYGSTGGFRGRKHDLYEGGIRVPGIVRWPGHVAPGSVSDAPVIGYDLLPTVAAMVGAPLPDDRPIDGTDISSLLAGGPLERQQPLFWEFDDDQGFHFALRDGRWKLLATEDLDTVHLYDLIEDPFEIFDRAAEKPALVARLIDVVRRIDADIEADPLRPARVTSDR